MNLISREKKLNQSLHGVAIQITHIKTAETESDLARG